MHITQITHLENGNHEIILGHPLCSQIIGVEATKITKSRLEPPVEHEMSLFFHLYNTN